MAARVLADPKLLRMFERLYATRSVTRAAESLGLSQPTASIWLASLRRLFGDPLFIRTPEGMQPTPRAEALIDRARQILHDLEDLSAASEAFDPARARTAFRIFMTDASHVTLLPRLLAHVRKAAPGIALEAALISDQVGADLVAGNADLAIGHLPQLESGFRQQRLYDQDWVCLARSDHPRIQGALPLEAYAAEAHVLVSAGTGHRLLQAALETEGVERRVALTLPGFLGLSAILGSTDLVATLPRHTAETLAAAARLQVLPCPFAVPGFQVKQYWHARRETDQGGAWLRDACWQLFGR